MKPQINLDRPLVSSVTDENSPTSVINMVSKTVGRKIKALVQGDLVKELLTLDETRLLKELKRRGFRPTATDNFVRVQFWNEYLYARNHGPPYVITLERIYSRICTQEVFLGFYLLSPLPLAWVLCPPIELELKLQEALTYGIDDMRSFFDVEIDPEKGSANQKINMKIGALRILGELAGMINNRGQVRKIVKKQTLAREEAKRAITEEDLVERKRLIELKMKEQEAKGG